MKTSAHILVVIATFSTLLSCAPSVTVTTDYDKDADFGKYKTYKLTDEAKNIAIDDLDRRRLIAAIESGLAAKGFTPASNSDILVDLRVSTEKKENTRATTSGPYGGAYRYGWGAASSNTDIDVQSYVEGTLFIDFIDAAKKHLVWQGRGVKVLDLYATPQEKDQRIKSAVNTILAKYPPAIKKK